MPRKKIHNPLQGKLEIAKTPDPKPVRRYASRSRGRIHGLGICQFWAYLFQLNEMLSRTKKMTDEEIKRQVLLEFPDRKALKKLGAVGEKGPHTVNYYRQMYNLGRFTSGLVPELQSHRYGPKGIEVNPRTGKSLLPTLKIRG